MCRGEGDGEPRAIALPRIRGPSQGSQVLAWAGHPMEAVAGEAPMEAIAAEECAGVPPEEGPGPGAVLGYLASAETGRCLSG